MSVPSIKYVFFLLTVSLLSFLINRQFRSLLLMLASLGFYALFQTEYVLLLIAGTVICYLSAIAYEDAWLNVKKIWITVGCIWFFGQLFFYKYLGFFSVVLAGITGEENSSLIQRLLPVGISFYTFTSLSYLFDVVKERTKAERSFINCALYISFFPAILSGPINRANDLLPQIREPEQFSLSNLKQGLLRIVMGTMKKLVVANTLGKFVDAVYGAPLAASRGVVMLAVAVYSIQIYFDFSGYTDIAIGAAKIMGFKLPENFNKPYFAAGVRDFWRRWHISLTSWFRDYLYIPLGGSRGSRGRLCLNILIVFSLSGLWHGADWSFILWGLLNGVFQVIEMLLNPVRKKIWRSHHNWENALPLKAFRIAVTFVLISVTWVFFRAESVAQAIDVLSRVALGPSETANAFHDYTEFRPFAVAFLCVLLFSWFDFRQINGKASIIQNRLMENSLLFWLVLAVLTVFISVFGVYGGGYNAGAFIYFQF